MGTVTLVQAQATLDAYILAERKVLAGQSYSIGDRALTRADLREIRDGIIFWNKQVGILTAGRTKPPVRQIIPRD
jgi:hypothetical protein